jgi:hypothetical protein
MGRAAARAAHLLRGVATPLITVYADRNQIARLYQVDIVIRQQ